MDLNTKVYWHDRFVSSWFYPLSQYHKDNKLFVNRLGEQPWSVADILRACMRTCRDTVGNKTACEDGCPKIVMNGIKQHNEYVAKELPTNMTGVDSDMPITWGTSPIIAAVFGIYGKDLVFPENGYKPFKILPLMQDEITKINKDYVLSINQLRDACENMVAGLQYYQLRAMKSFGVSQDNTRCDEFVARAIDENDKESEYQHSFSPLNLEQEMGDVGIYLNN